jgi:P4 family phage/plasmid primase-like protien
MSRELTISRYHSRYDAKKELTVQRITWQDLAGMLTNVHRTAETFAMFQDMAVEEKAGVKDIGWLIGGEMNPPFRKKQNLVGRDVLLLDADHLELWDVDPFLDSYSNLEYAVHSTHSHSTDAPRLRIAFPLSRTVTPAEYEALARRVAEKAGMDFFDDTTYQNSRIMFLPSASCDAPVLARMNEGKWIDVDKVLATYKDPADWEEWPQSTTEKEKGGLRERKDKAADPLTIPGIIGAFCRAYPIDEAILEFSLPYTESDMGEDRYTYLDGSGADGAVFYRDDSHLYSHHESDPASGNRNAWDLVRLHRHAHLDEGVDKDTQIKDLPSQKKMNEYARTLGPVLEEWDGAASVVNAEDEFEEVTDAETGEVTKVKKAAITHDGLRTEIAACIEDHGKLTGKEHKDFILKCAASSLDETELSSIAVALIDKKHTAYTGSNKVGVLNDIKARRKALNARASETDEVKDLQVEFLDNFLNTRYRQGEYLRRTGQMFWSFRGTHWQPVEDEYIGGQLFNSLVEIRTGESRKERRALEAAVRENQTTAIWNSLWKAFCHTQTERTGNDADPMGLQRLFLPRMINCVSGEIHYNDEGQHQVRKHHAESYCTSVVPVKYNKEAKCPEWDRFCEMTFSKARDPKGMQRHLEEFCGYILNQSREFRTWALFYGGTASGKSTIGKVLASMMGTTVKAMPLANYNGQNTHATAGLVGMQLLLDDDYPEGLLLPDGLLKTISEEKAMDGNPKGTKEFKFVCRALPLICSNNPPSTRDTTGALYDRALVFPLNHTVPRKERDEQRMRTMISDEIEGIFLRFVRGAGRLFRRGDWEFPVDCTIAWESWIQKSNPLRLFLELCTEKGAADDFLPTSELHSKYKAFMEDEYGYSGKPIGRNAFLTKIDGIWGGRTRNNDGTHHGWRARRIVAGSVNDHQAGDDEFDDQGPVDNPTIEEEWDV